MSTAENLSELESATIDEEFGEFFMVTGIFNVTRGKSEDSIEMPLTVRKDGSDVQSAISEASEELCDISSHAYTTAEFSHFL
jgi:hypothetical protein